MARESLPSIREGLPLPVDQRLDLLEVRVVALEEALGRPADDATGTAPTGMRKLFGEVRGELVALRASITLLDEHLRSDRAAREQERAAETEALAKRRAPLAQIGVAIAIAIVLGALSLLWQLVLHHVH